MYLQRHVSWRPVYQPQSGDPGAAGGVRRIAVDPDAPPLEPNADGVVDLWPALSRLFAVLRRENQFDGQTNSFHRIEAVAVHHVSDPREKEGARDIDRHPSRREGRRVPTGPRPCGWCSPWRPSGTACARRARRPPA